MKKLVCLIAAALLWTAGSLSAQQIRSIDIGVYINDDGDAYISQEWDVTIVSGTEWYIPIENLGGMSIRGLTVKENGQEFIDDGRSWDSSRSREEKAGHSGIIEKRDGVELCWGQGAYGDHKWTVGFVALGLVQSLKDYDAFNFMFVNPDLVAAPKKVTITFSRLSDEQFSFDFTRFWFFGTEGKSELLEDGTIRFEAENLLRSDSVICMMRFEKGIFNPEISKDMTFEKMQKKAFKGSSYKEEKKDLFRGLTFEDIIEMLVGAAFVLAVFGIVLLFIYCLIRDLILKLFGTVWKKSVFGSTKPRGWAREAPFEGSIPIAAHLLKEGSRLAVLNSFKPENCIGAYFLKWIQEGKATPVKAADGHFDMQFPKEMPDFADDAEKALYQKAFDAAGSNMILEKGEFDAWAKKHYRSLAGWPDVLTKEGCSKLSAFSGDKISEAAKLLQFKNFLREFTISGEREVPEVGLWGQYLVFAQVFGIADKVAEGFAKRYPLEFNDYSQQYGLDTVAMRSVMHSWSTTARSAYRSAYDAKISAEAKASSSSHHTSSGGFGGFSSRGGGGGFSGGGRGGGSR
ncbi:MAG: DUF2207 domain-containing protein [Bacteroidales bacterium]|nr:DUF2207 domain-containing protein [Bacteroidales bacterium]